MSARFSPFRQCQKIKNTGWSMKVRIVQQKSTGKFTWFYLHSFGFQIIGGEVTSEIENLRKIAVSKIFEKGFFWCFFAFLKHQRQNPKVFFSLIASGCTETRACKCFQTALTSATTSAQMGKHTQYQCKQKAQK